MIHPIQVDRGESLQYDCFRSKVTIIKWQSRLLLLEVSWQVVPCARWDSV